jgi:hypothetical protein
MKKPFALSFEGWDAWHTKAKAEHPLQYFFTETIPVKWGRCCRRVCDVKYWFLYRFHPRHHYNIVRTGLPPGYYDKDVLLLHACFNLLKDFVEREKPFDHFDIEAESRKDIWIEIRSLYDWWTKIRPARGDGIFEQHGAWDQEDNEYLIRLINVRGHLWT